MNFALTILTLGAWVLMAQKMSNWNWFVKVKSWFPAPLAELWDAWAGCSFCGGFWIALLLKTVTGLATVNDLNHLHPLDALATTTLGSLTLGLTGPLNLLLNAARAKQESEQRRAAAQQTAASATA
jgi:hypothetical protein